jgi:hypothetical protein
MLQHNMLAENDSVMLKHNLRKNPRPSRPAMFRGWHGWHAMKAPSLLKKAIAVGDNRFTSIH